VPKSTFVAVFLWHVNNPQLGSLSEPDTTFRQVGKLPWATIRSHFAGRNWSSSSRCESRGWIVACLRAKEKQPQSSTWALISTKCRSWELLIVRKQPTPAMIYPRIADSTRKQAD